MRFIFYRQISAMDCGPTCLRMIARYYGKSFSINFLRQQTGFDKYGVSLLGIIEAAERIGFHTTAAQLSYDRLMEVHCPAILHWEERHFVVLLEANNRYAKIADPVCGIIKYKKAEFQNHWSSGKNENNILLGIALLITPGSLK